MPRAVYLGSCDSGCFRYPFSSQFVGEKVLCRHVQPTWDDVTLAHLFLVLCVERDVLFIGTRFSNLYTAVDSPAEAA